MKRLVDLVFWLSACLPAGLAVALGRTLGWCICHVIRFRRRVVETHLALAFPELTPAARRTLMCKFYRHLGLLVVELLRLPSMRPEDLLATCDLRSMEQLHAVLARGKGVLLLGGHFGNWEMGLAAAARHGYKVQAVVKEIKGALGQHAVSTMRGAHGIQLIPRRKSIHQILKGLKQNAAIVFVLDQNMTADEGVFVDFFGRPACTMSGLATLAVRNGTPVVPAFFYRDDDLRHHHALILPEIVWESVSDKPEENIRHNTQRYTAALEQFIREHPEQWIWMHKRWRTQPPAAPGPATGDSPAAR